MRIAASLASSWSGFSPAAVRLQTWRIIGSNMRHKRVLHHLHSRNFGDAPEQSFHFAGRNGPRKRHATLIDRDRDRMRVRHEAAQLRADARLERLIRYLLVPEQMGAFS